MKADTQKEEVIELIRAGESLLAIEKFIKEDLTLVEVFTDKEFEELTTPTIMSFVDMLFVTQKLMDDFSIARVLEDNLKTIEDAFASSPVEERTADKAVAIMKNNIKQVKRQIKKIEEGGSSKH